MCIYIILKKMVRKGKKNKMSAFQMWMIFFVAVFVTGFLGNTYFNIENTSTTQIKKEILDKQLAGVSCPADGITTLTLNVQNPLNTTGAEKFDVELTLLGEGGKKTTGTDSTDGEYSLDCGIIYTLIVESSDGASGDNANIVSVIEGQDATATEDGTVTFLASGNSYNLKVGVSQHATLEAKVYDNEDARFAYDTGDASNSEFEADGTIFTDGTNATAFALTNSGDFIDFKISLRTVQVDTEFGDLGWYVAIEAPVSEYDEPTVSFAGLSLTEMKGDLNSYESKQLSNYEYVYRVENSIVRKSEALEFYIESNSDASTDLQIDLFAIGKVDSINGVDILTSSAQDNSASTTVFAIHDITVDIS